jgi:hypothetical protein
VELKGHGWKRGFTITQVALVGPKVRHVVWDRETHERRVARITRALRNLRSAQGNAARATAARRGRYKVDPTVILAAVARELKRSSPQRSNSDVYRAVAQRQGVSAKTVERSVRRAQVTRQA